MTNDILTRFILKGLTEMGLRYRVPLPGPFYYSGRVGPKRRVPRGSSTGCGPMGFIVKRIVYPSIAMFVAGLAIMVALFYGVFWAVRRWQRNRWKCRPVAPCFPVQRPGLQGLAGRPVSGSYGFVPARRPARPVPYGFVPAPARALSWRSSRLTGTGCSSSKLGWSLPSGWHRPSAFRGVLG